MITQNSNNKPSGSTGKTCDAGTPIMGKTTTNEYQIVQVDANGVVQTSGGGGGGGITPIAPTVASNIGSPSTYIIPASGWTSGYLIARTQVTTTPITAGLYRINPFFIVPGSNSGVSVNIFLTLVGSSLESFVSTITLFSGSFNGAGDGQFVDGLYGFWHSNSMQQLNNNVSIAYNRSNSTEIYLNAGLYTLFVVTDTGVFSSTGGNAYIGFYELAKIG